MINLSNIGDKFEHDLSIEFGLYRVPGSGNRPVSQLDLYGNGFRWSLKATDASSASIKKKDIAEAIQACFGINGTGETPLWAYRIQDEDMIMMRKSDFVALQRGEIRAINEEKGKEKVNERRRLASTPSLLRDGD